MSFLQHVHFPKKISLSLFIYIKTPQTKNGKKTQPVHCTPNSSSCFSYLRLHILLFHILHWHQNVINYLKYDNICCTVEFFEIILKRMLGYVLYSFAYIFM